MNVNFDSRFAFFLDYGRELLKTFLCGEWYTWWHGASLEAGGPNPLIILLKLYIWGIYVHTHIHIYVCIYIYIYTHILPYPIKGEQWACHRWQSYGVSDWTLSTWLKSGCLWLNFESFLLNSGSLWVNFGVSYYVLQWLNSGIYVWNLSLPG
jgi:hypothetical protein